MKSLGSHAKAGQHNLKGKKQKLLSCKCCVLKNLKDREEGKEVKRELKAARAAMGETDKRINPEYTDRRMGETE